MSVVEILILVAMILFSIASIIMYVVMAMTKEDSVCITNLKEWLLYATTIAEKELGGGTGSLKLRYVYDMFVDKFTWLSKIISFEKFSIYVDEVLENMKNIISTNKAINNYVNPKEGE